MIKIITVNKKNLKGEYVYVYKYGIVKYLMLCVYVCAKEYYVMIM